MSKAVFLEKGEAEQTCLWLPLVLLLENGREENLTQLFDSRMFLPLPLYHSLLKFLYRQNLIFTNTYLFVCLFLLFSGHWIKKYTCKSNQARKGFLLMKFTCQRGKTGNKQASTETTDSSKEFPPPKHPHRKWGPNGGLPQVGSLGHTHGCVPEPQDMTSVQIPGLLPRKTPN